MAQGHDESSNDIAQLLQVLDLAQRVRQILIATTREVLHVTVEQAFILCQIDLNGGRATISDLAARVHRSNQTVTARINSLERRGLVQRSRHQGSDLRNTWVALTAEGVSLLATYRASAASLLEQSLGSQRWDERRRCIPQALRALECLLDG